MKKKLTAIAAAGIMIFAVGVTPAEAALTHRCTKGYNVITTTNYQFALNLVNSGWRCTNITIWG